MTKIFNILRSDDAKFIGMGLLWIMPVWTAAMMSFLALLAIRVAFFGMPSGIGLLERALNIGTFFGLVGFTLVIFAYAVIKMGVTTPGVSLAMWRKIPIKTFLKVVFFITPLGLLFLGLYALSKILWAILEIPSELWNALYGPRVEI